MQADAERASPATAVYGMKVAPIPEVLADLLEIVDDAVLVREESIVEGMRLLNDRADLVVEPSAALGIAAVLEAPGRFAGKRVATILCGGNVMPEDFEGWIQGPPA